MKRLLVLALLLAACGTPNPTSNPPGSTLKEGCPDDDGLFRTRLWTPVLRTKCLLCHVQGGVAGGTRFLLVDESDADWLKKDEAAFRKVARIDDGGGALAFLKPTGRHPNGHGGGVVVKPGSPEEADLKLLVDWMRGEVPDCRVPAETACVEQPGARMLRRLTHVEYRRTVKDLLGVDVDPSASLAPDEVVDGFQNNATALKVSPLLADQYRAIAEDLATRAVQSNLAKLVPCRAQGDVACAAQFVNAFGKRAFRRPLTTDEKARYLKIFHDAAEDGFDAGVTWTITALLQSPHFLYRAELGGKGADGKFTLTPWELATELSYLFLQTTPDDELLAAAESGALMTPEGLKTQADRLASDPRAPAAMTSFVEQWLLLDRLPIVPRDTTVFPEFTPEIRTAMRGEISRYVEDLVKKKATLADALGSKRTFLTDQLATYYGVPAGSAAPDDGGYREVSLEGTGYGGLLGLGGLLTTHALPNGSSPIHRGKLVRERFLCQPLPPPPANINASPPAIDPTKTTRERYLAHAQKQECRQCHQLIDPIGFSFEHFDGVGRFRAKDGTHDIDASGNIVGSPASDGSFDGLADLSSHLATSPDVEKCFLHTWATYASGASDDGGLACGLKAKLEKADFSSIRYALTGTAHFRGRTGEADEGDAPWMNAPTADPTLDPLPPPPAGSEVSFTVNETSRWMSGACFDAAVTNNSQAPLTWRVKYEVEGHIDNLWNATATAPEGTIYFTGASYNATLDPGATASFGFCTSF